LHELFGELLPPCIRDLSDRGKSQTIGCALRDTRRLQAFINTILAQITLVYLAGAGFPLRHSPGTGDYTGLAADTKAFLDKYNAVLVTSLHGSGRAGIDTPWLFAVKAGHVDKIATWNLARVRFNFHHFTKKRTFTWVIFVFAMHFAGFTTNTIRYILGYNIFAHPSSSGYESALTVTKHP
jgi:hypothetical protein